MDIDRSQFWDEENMTESHVFTMELECHYKAAELEIWLDTAGPLW